MLIYKVKKKEQASSLKKKRRILLVFREDGEFTVKFSAPIRAQALRQCNIIRSSVSKGYRFTDDIRSFSYREIKRLRLERNRGAWTVRFSYRFARWERSAGVMVRSENISEGVIRNVET